MYERVQHTSTKIEKLDKYNRKLLITGLKRFDLKINFRSNTFSLNVSS